MSKFLLHHFGRTPVEIGRLKPRDIANFVVRQTDSYKPGMSAVAPVQERKFLGYRLLLNGKMGIAPKSLERAQDEIRQITRRHGGVSFSQVIAELNDFLAGWFQYYRLAALRGDLQRMDAWIRRKLGCFRLKQRKRGQAIATFLQPQGVPADQAWRIASSGKGWWRLALSPPVKRAMSGSPGPSYPILAHSRLQRETSCSLSHPGPPETEALLDSPQRRRGRRED